MRVTAPKSIRTWFYFPVYLLMPGTSHLLYSHILNAGFVFDDVVFRDNPMVHITRLGQVLAG